MATPPRSERLGEVPPGEDVETRAARLGITAERVLDEYRRIAFSDISRILGWDDEGRVKPTPSGDLSADDASAIAEIVASASTGNIYRVKLHDKKPVLDALARHLGMLPPLKHVGDADTASATGGSGGDPREDLIRAVDRVAAEAAARPRDPDAAA